MNANIDFRAVVMEHSAANKNANLYFLLDHAGMPGLHRKLGSSVEWTSLFEDTYERNALRAAPTLVLVYENDRPRISQRLFEWIGQHGTYSSGVIVLASVLSIKPLTTRLSLRLNVRLSGGMDGILRFYDPRIFENLITVFSAEQSRVFFSPGEKWWYVDRTGQLGVMYTEFALQEKFVSPLEISEAQEFHLLDASEADQVLALLRQNAPGLLSRLALREQYDFVKLQIQRARTINLISTIDFAIYSCAALEYGTDFASSAMWSEALRNVRIGKLTFSQALSEIDYVEENL